jgi:hypothetical protein
MEQYWAAKPKGEIADIILDKVQDHKDYLQAAGYIGELRKSYRAFYGTSYIESIDQSLKAIHMNHYANLVRHVHVMVTAQRPAWEPRAINSDLESQATTLLASSLLDYYMREKLIDKKLSEAVERALFLRESWISLDWNATSGDIYGETEEGMPIYEGDVEVNSHSMLDITRDYKRRDMNHQWFIVRKFKNKYDLAAKYEDMAEKLVALKGDNKFDIEYELNVSKYGAKKQDENSDLIATYTLYHAKTDAMPDGRMVEVAESDVVLFDGPLPYSRPYVFCITPSQYYENAYGHSNAMDLLPVQDAMNMTVSAILTNQAANAVQNFQVPKGAAPKVTQIMDGLNIWEYDPKAGKMETMDLLKTAPEVFKFAEYLQAQQELLSGVSQINRGQAPATMSGTAMALLQQQAIQFSSGIQNSYNHMLEQVGTALIELLQTYAVVPRVAQISGKMKKSYIKEFTGKDLAGVSKVIVDSANPLTKTSAGRVEIANQLLATPNMIKTPEQYLGVLTTGNLEPLWEHDNSARMLIKAENEELMEGKPQIAVLTDDDAIHVLEHSCILNSPEARRSPQILQNTLDHIQQHIDNAKAKDPALTAMLKQASFAQQAPPMAQGGGSTGDGLPPVMDNANPITQQAEQVALPEPAQPPVV